MTGGIIKKFRRIFFSDCFKNFLVPVLLRWGEKNPNQRNHTVEMLVQKKITQNMNQWPRKC